MAFDHLDSRCEKGPAAREEPPFRHTWDLDPHFAHDEGHKCGDVKCDQYNPAAKTSPSLASFRRVLWPLAVLTVLAAGSLFVASATAGSPGASRLLFNPQPARRLIKFGYQDDQVEWVSPAAIACLRGPHIDLTKGVDSLRAVHPELVGVSDYVITRLGNHTRRGPGFIDITDDNCGRRSHSSPEPRVYPTPTPSKYPVLSMMFDSISPSGLLHTVSKLSSYPTRHYLSAGAAAPATWIQDQFSEAAGSDNIKTIANAFGQQNVIAAIPRKPDSTFTDVIVIGAHIDSTSSTERAPGADDDASGIAVVLQALQILKTSGWSGSRDVEFHAYGGEEGGLLGSCNVAKQYRRDKRQVSAFQPWPATDPDRLGYRSVRAMLQLDMVAYQPTSNPVLTVLEDTDPALQAFSQKVISSYVPEASLHTNKCGYGCSDHFSWHNQGFPSVSIDESGPSDAYLNPNYHTASDTIDKLDFDKASKFVKASAITHKTLCHS